MKDLLLFTPLDDFALAQYEFLPLGILYLSSFIENAGFQADVLHGRVLDIPTGYKYYGISATTNQYPVALKALKHIRHIQPDAMVILGGPHLNAKKCVDEALQSELWDYLVVGEGEFALRDILNKKYSRGSLIYGTPVPDLDKIPSPNYHKLPISQYNFPLAENCKCVNVITSRGCPYKCIFCSTAGTQLRQLSPEGVERELSVLKDTFGFNSFVFVDDTMSLKRSRFHKVLNIINDFNVVWRSYGRVNALTYTDLKLMKESGCLEIAIGAESGSQYILDLIRKGTNVKKNTRFVNWCRDLNLICNTMLIVGLPGETKATIQETINWVAEAKPQAFGFNIFFPFPDAPIWKEYDEHYNQYITLYDYDWKDAKTKGKSIEQCYISTPELTRKDILNEYYRCFEELVRLTGFDPRNRGTRKLKND